MKHAEIELVKSYSLGALVRDELKHLILTGCYEPGERLSEQKIADVLGVSRGPVREAFRALASEGLLVAVRNKGVAVRRLNPSEISDLYELRATLEGKIAEKAAISRDHVLCDMLDGIVTEMEQRAAEQDAQGVFSCNERFHASIIEACENRTLVAACRSTMAELQLARVTNFFRHGSLGRSVHNHRRLAARFRSASPSAIRRSFEEHVLAGRSLLLSHVDEDGDHESLSAQAGPKMRE